MFCFQSRARLRGSCKGLLELMGNFPSRIYRQDDTWCSRSPTPNQNLEYRNEEVLRQYESKGTMVTLEPGQKAEVTVSVLTEDEE